MLNSAFIWLLLFTISHRYSGLMTKFHSASTVGCISHHEAKRCLEQKPFSLQKPNQKHLSIDLGRTKQALIFDSSGLNTLEHNLIASWDELSDIAEKGVGCHALYDDGSKPWAVSAMSDKTGFPASLCPPLLKSGAPTMVLGGFTMHRIVGEEVNPMTDTVHKIAAVKDHIKPNSLVLDTCMGLGYTASEAARLLTGSGRLTTIEFDDVSVEMCRYNPWSHGLFDGSQPIDTHMVRNKEKKEI